MNVFVFDFENFLGVCVIYSLSSHICAYITSIVCGYHITRYLFALQKLDVA